MSRADIINAMRRAAERLEQEADAIVRVDPFDYSVEFPAEDARLIREGIELLTARTQQART